MIKVKVCGMRDIDNTREVIKAGPDIIGFIFYPQSKRYIGEIPDQHLATLIPETIRKAGVFVNEKKEKIVELARLFGLELLQLHGQEPVAVCNELMNAGYNVIKAFGITEGYDFSQLIPFVPACHYFLFDTLSEQHGGTGKKFSWDILTDYKLDKPFFLSGGIGPEDIVRVRKLNHPAFYGVDINSRFEIMPGIKDPEKIDTFIRQIKTSEI